MAATARKNPKESVERKKLVFELAEFKRDRILAEAADLFFERGYPRTSVETIAERLGVTKPFVYYHFTSKLDLLSEICQRGTKQALDIANQALAALGSPSQRLVGFVKDFTMASLVNQKYVTIYFREEIHLSRDDAECINHMRKEIDDRITKLLIEGCEIGEFELADPVLTALAITGMASFPFAWRGAARSLDKDRVCTTLADHALRMVSKTDGIKTAR